MHPSDPRAAANLAGSAPRISDGVLVADSLGLPEEAHDINVARAGSTLSIWSDYTELIELPFHGQRLPFHPHAEGHFDTAPSQ